MKKVAIIGLGWLGLPLAQHLSAQGWQVKGTKRTITYIEGIDMFPFSLGDPIGQELGELLRVDSLVINIPPSQFSDEAYFLGIQQLVQTARQHNVQHIIFVSTTGVFPQKNGIFDETCTDFIESGTVAVERWLQTLPLDCDILRLAGLIGQNRHPVRYLAGKKDLKNGGQPVNLVHQQDVIRAIELLLNTPKGQRIFHLCASQHPTRQDYYAEMAKKLGLADLQFLPEILPVVRLISGEKICRELGFVYEFDDPFAMPID